MNKIVLFNTYKCFLLVRIFFCFSVRFWFAPRCEGLFF